MKRQLNTETIGSKSDLEEDGKTTAAQVRRQASICRCAALLGKQSEGGALVEVALTFPLLLMVISGLCAFGLAFNNELTLTNAVGAGAQYLQLIRTTTTDPCADTLGAIEAAAPYLKASNITLTLNMNGATVTGGSCSGDQTDLVQGSAVTVTATYPCALPVYAMGFTQACQLTAKVSEYEY
jgi:Flp pilus assembly protein TadG